MKIPQIDTRKSRILPYLEKQCHETATSGRNIIAFNLASITTHSIVWPFNNFYRAAWLLRSQPALRDVESAGNEPWQQLFFIHR